MSESEKSAANNNTAAERKSQTEKPASTNQSKSEPEKPDAPAQTSTQRKRTQSDETGGDGKSDGKKTKNDDDETTPKVLSYNDWEHAEFADKDKKAKFLRLMGACKESHSGKIVIGDTNPEDEGKHHRDPQTDHKLVADLERQYTKSMSDHLKHRDQRHRGFGYHGDSEASLAGVSKDSAAVVGCSKRDVGAEKESDAKNGAETGKDSGSSSGSSPKKTLQLGGMKFVSSSSGDGK